jgi:phosphate-selective porin OprO/OprP
MIKQLLAGIFASTIALSAYADSTTDIVDALVGKGVLTEEEGKLITKGHDSKKKNQLEARFKDGITLSDEKGDNTFSIGGRLHTDYRMFTNDQPNDVASVPTNSANQSDTFDIRRARIEMKGKFNKNFDFLVATDLAGTSAGNTNGILDQAYINYTYDKPFQIRVGQFKAPMNLEKVTSSNNTDFMERALVNQLAANEDRGVMLHGVLPGYTYALAVTTGEGGCTGWGGVGSGSLAAGAASIGTADHNSADADEVLGLVFH